MQQLRTKTADAAIGRWPGILVALGVDQKFLSNRHGPCPICGGTDRYRMDDREGRGTWFCSHCGAGDGLSLLMKMYGWSFVQACKEVDRVIGTVQQASINQERTEAEKLVVIEKVLKQSRKVQRDDPVWKYLNRRTGIENAPVDIRFHPGMKHSAGGSYPVMLAVMRDKEGRGVSVHRTYITNDGQKAPVTPAKKFMQGRSLNGSAVRLSEVLEHIGIGEGIETSLACSTRFGIPTWAATNAGLLEVWMPPMGIKKVTIFADNDSNFVGQDAAYSLARRLVRDGLVAEVVIPEKVDSDWADTQ